MWEVWYARGLLGVSMPCPQAQSSALLGSYFGLIKVLTCVVEFERLRIGEIRRSLGGEILCAD